MRRLSLWGPPLLWAAVIFGFSSIPDLRTGLSADLELRRLAHVGEYFVLCALLRRALAGEGVSPRAAGAGAFALAVLYAASDEWHQSFVPGRTGAPAHVAIDALGAFLAWARSRG